jgi:uncharacterized membrane protein
VPDADDPADVEEDFEPAVPRWPWIAGTALSVIGFGVAGYLTYEHYSSSTSLSCPAGGGIVNCLKVTTSQYAKIGGVPVAVLGLVFFAVMIGIQSRPAWASTSPVMRIGRLLWSLVGVGTAAWLIYVELFKVDAVCLWCTAVHVIAVLLFVVTAFATAATADLAPEDCGPSEIPSPKDPIAIADAGRATPDQGTTTARPEV